MNHREKLRLARRYQSVDELKRKGESAFQGGFWQTRALEIRIRVARRQQPELIKKLGL